MRKIKIMFSLIIICFLCIKNLYGVSNLNIKLNFSKESIGPNEEIFATLNTSNLLSDETIQKVEFTLDYDEHIFNQVSNSDIVLYNIGKNIENDTTNNTFVISNIRSNDIIKIKFISKSSLKVSYANIKLKDIRVLTNSSYINIGDVSSKIQINSSEVTQTINKENENINTGFIAGTISNVDTSILDKFNEFINFDSLKNIDIAEIMLNPLKIFLVFIKAFFIVIIINVVAKMICKFSFNYLDILKRRRKSRKLTKVLNDLYE